MTIKLAYIAVFCLWVFALTGCVKEIPVEAPVPESKTIPFEKPTMPLGHDERGREKSWRLREQPAKQPVVAVRSVDERDER